MLKQVLKACLASLVIPAFSKELAEGLLDEFSYDCVIHTSGSDTSKVSHITEVEQSRSILLIPDSEDPKATASWLAKAIHESRKGKTVLVVLPIKVDQPWFIRYVMGVASEVRFLDTPKIIKTISQPLAVIVYKRDCRSTTFSQANFNGKVYKTFKGGYKGPSHFSSK
jgi:hypothetical protein